MFFYILRIDLSMAIVCMVREPNHPVERPVWNTSSFNSSNDWNKVNEPRWRPVGLH